MHEDSIKITKEEPLSKEFLFVLFENRNDHERINFNFMTFRKYIFK